jgi:hypothetical protein
VNKREPGCGGSTSIPQHRWRRHMQLHTPALAISITLMSRTLSPLTMIIMTNHPVSHLLSTTPCQRAHLLHHLQYTSPQQLVRCPYHQQTRRRKIQSRKITLQIIHGLLPQLVLLLEPHLRDPQNITAWHTICHPLKTSLSICTTLWDRQSSPHSSVHSKRATSIHSLASALTTWLGTALQMRHQRYWDTEHKSEKVSDQHDGQLRPMH